LIPNLDKLMDEEWVNPLKQKMANVDPLSIEWFDKMIKLYTREGGNFYLVLNWNLRANEWYNVQATLSPVVFALKCVCEGYCYQKFGDIDPRFKPYEGKVHRVLSYRTKIAEQIKDFREGDEIYFGGFTSTTKNFKQTSKIAMTRGFKYKEGESGIYLNIVVAAEHKCAVDITEKSEFKYEEEVLVSCFTRFRILRIERGAKKHIAVYLRSLPPVYASWDQWNNERKVRETLASLAYSYRFDDAIELVKKHGRSIPNLINSTRPDSSKFWTIGHQIVHSKKENAKAYLDQIKDVGFWEGARDNLGNTVYDVNDTIAKPKKDWNCTKCKQQNKASQKFCPQCGTKQDSSGCLIM